MAKTTHANPAELAELAHARYLELLAEPDPGPCKLRRAALPELAALEPLLSTAFQASLLREEDRPVRFRLFVGEPEFVPVEAGPPQGLHRLSFERPRPYHEQELRRLSQAAKYPRALIGVRCHGTKLEIWGIVQSGPRWLQSARGGRDLPSPIPDDTVVVRADGPGHIAIEVGEVTLAELRSGNLSGLVTNVFRSQWLAERFAPARSALLRDHAALSGEPEIPLQSATLRSVSQQMIKRMIATIRDSHHGGSVLFVPAAHAASVLGERGCIQLKYAFVDDPARRRYRSLMLSLMSELVTEAKARQPRPASIDWSVYQASTRSEVAQLDEAIMEMSHLIAGLSAVDGVVVLNERFDVLGFGGEIVGSLPDVTTVRRARDLEGNDYDVVPIDNVGTRHRAVYRLCTQEHSAFAVVISQDGDVQFVAWQRGALTFWKHRNMP